MGCPHSVHNAVRTTFRVRRLSVILVIYLTQLGLTDAQAGLLLTLTLTGDTAVSLWLTTRADRFGRRRTLVIGAIPMVLAGIVFASTTNMIALVVAGTIGVISPSGHEVGPFPSIEQATLSHALMDRARRQVFAWYTLTGAVATALGSWSAGLITQSAHSSTLAVESARRVVWMYAGLGLILMGLFTQLSGSVEVSRRADAVRRSTAILGISHSCPVVLRLDALFALGSFGGGFVVQSFVSYWFHLRFRTEPAVLGSIFFGTNLFAGVSALLASKLAG